MEYLQIWANYDISLGGSIDGGIDHILLSHCYFFVFV